MGSFNYFTFTIHMGKNSYINTGVQVLFKAISTCRNDISSKNLLNRPTGIYAEINAPDFLR